MKKQNFKKFGISLLAISALGVAIPVSLYFAQQPTVVHAEEGKVIGKIVVIPSVAVNEDGSGYAIEGYTKEYPIREGQDFQFEAEDIPGYETLGFMGNSKSFLFSAENIKNLIEQSGGTFIISSLYKKSTNPVVDKKVIGIVRVSPSVSGGDSLDEYQKDIPVYEGEDLKISGYDIPGYTFKGFSGQEYWFMLASGLRNLFAAGNGMTVAFAEYVKNSDELSNGVKPSSEIQPSSEEKPSTASSSETQASSEEKPSTASSSETQPSSEEKPSTASSSEVQSSSEEKPSTTSSSEVQPSSEEKPSIAPSTDVKPSSNSIVQGAFVEPATAEEKYEVLVVDGEIQYDDEGNPILVAKGDSATSEALPTGEVKETSSASSYGFSSDSLPTSSSKEPVQSSSLYGNTSNSSLATSEETDSSANLKNPISSNKVGAEDKVIKAVTPTDKKESLPQTGDTNSILALSLGSSILGLFAWITKTNYYQGKHTRR